MEQETTTVPMRATTTKRQSPIPVSKYNKSPICHQQPPRRSQLSWPAFETEDPRIQPPRPSSSRFQQPRHSERRQSLVSRASQRTKSKSRKSSNRRPTISNPTDFRRSDASFDFMIRDEEPPRAISPIQRRLSPFRPIQLSIYMPGNELPALPRFSDDDDDDDDVPVVPGIERPAQALMKTRSEPVLTRHLSSFSIPRKPIGSSRANSMELAQATRTSIDSGLTLNNNEASASTHKRSTSIDRLRSDHRHSLSASKSAQEFLEIINAPLPPLPQSTPTSHQQITENAPKTAYSIYRSASEQSLRLRTHLEERQVSIQACDTISEKEERSPVSPLTPPQPQLSTFATFHRASSTTSRSSHIFVQQSFQQRADSTIPQKGPNNNPVATIATHPAWIDSDYELPLPSLHKARSSSGSSTLFNEKMAEAGVSQLQMNDTDNTRPTVTTTISVCPSTPTLSGRLSAWLARSISSMQNNPSNDAPNPNSNTGIGAGGTRESSHSISSSRNMNRNSNWSITYPAPLTIGPNAVAVPGEIKKSKSAPGSKTTPLLGHARQQSSVSTYVTTSGEQSEVVDLEKFPLPVIVTERRISAVGLAF